MSNMRGQTTRTLKHGATCKIKGSASSKAAMEIHSVENAYARSEVSVSSGEGLATVLARTYHTNVALFDVLYASRHEGLLVGVLGQHMTTYILGTNAPVITFKTMVVLLPDGRQLCKVLPATIFGQSEQLV